MKVALLTVYTDNFKPLADIVIPNMQEYCSKHDYTLYTFDITGTDIYYGYKKIEKVLSILDDVDVVLCLDLDTLITNHDIKVESFIDEYNNFYITQDVNGINAGAFIVKNTEWSRKYLEDIYNSKDIFDCEQNAISSFFNINGYKVKILPHPSINSLIYDEYGPSWGVIGDRKISKPTREQGNWEHGDFILHLPGIPLEQRLEIFKNKEKEIIK